MDKQGMSWVCCVSVGGWVRGRHFAAEMNKSQPHHVLYHCHLVSSDVKGVRMETAGISTAQECCDYRCE